MRKATLPFGPNLRGRISAPPPQDHKGCAGHDSHHPASQGANCQTTTDHNGEVLRTTLQFRDNETSMSGLICIVADKRDAVLAASGKGGVFIDASRDAQGSPKEVSWHKPETDEAPAAFLERILD